MRYRPFGISGKAVSAVSLLLREAPNMTTPQAWWAMVFAASFQVPVVFCCTTTHWAISEPVRLQSHIQLADRAAQQAQRLGMAGQEIGVPA